jgi:hypothetical protein
VADAVDPAELLGVDVEQLAGAGALVADHGRPGLERGKAAEAEAAEHQADGGDAPPQLARDLRAPQSLPALALDRGGDLEGLPAGRGAGAGLRSCRARAPPARRRASHLYAVRTDTPAARAASSTPPAMVANARHQKESTMHRHAGILVDVHPRFQGQLFRSRNHSFNPRPRMNNLHSSYN